MTLKYKEYSDIRGSMRRGDVIAFGGKEIVSTIVKGATSSKSVTHVGIVVQSEYRKFDDDNDEREIIVRIMESGKSDGNTCIVENLLSKRVENYNGAMWWLRLREDIRDNFDSFAFIDFVFLQQGRPYDLPQAIRAAIDFADESGLTLNEENFSKLFCSEFVAAALERAGVLKCINASEVTPIELCQFQIYDPCYVIFKRDEKGKDKKIEGFNSQDKHVSESHRNVSES